MRNKLFYYSLFNLMNIKKRIRKDILHLIQKIFQTNNKKAKRRTKNMRFRKLARNIII